MALTHPQSCALTLTLLAASTAWSVEARAQASGDPAPVSDVDSARERDETSEVADEKRKGKKDRLEDRIKSVQRKVFLKKKRVELYPYFGLDLNDPFFQHFILGGSVAFHFADSFALEARAGGVIGSVEQSAVKFVRVNAGAVCNDCPEFQFHADLDVSWSPLYGKLSLLGEGIVHFDTYLTAGPGIFKTDAGVNPAVNVGIGQRFYLTDWLVARVELRDYIFLESREALSDVQNLLVLGFSVSLFFPTTFTYEFR